MKVCLPLLACLMLSASAFSQDTYEVFIVGNTNLYVPGSESNKGVYPILWYDKTTKPKYSSVDLAWAFQHSGLFPTRSV